MHYYEVNKRVCLFLPCGHLLGKGWPLGSRLWFLTVSLSLSHWYSESGLVLDCIDSYSFHPSLLYFVKQHLRGLTYPDVNRKIMHYSVIRHCLSFTSFI